MTITVEITHRIEGSGCIGNDHLAAVNEAESHIMDSLRLGLSPQEVVDGLGSDLMRRHRGLWEDIEARLDETGIRVVYRS